MRSVKVTAAQWRRRLIFLAGGIAVGAAAVVLAQVSDWAQVAFGYALAKSRYVSFLITPLGFALSVFLTIRYFPNSQGSGIPQAIAARQLGDQEARGRLVSMRIGIGKVLLTVLGLLCGASVGREGPTVQVGASIMFAIGRMSPRRQPGLILAGAAAGVAAAFNTPLAGIVFGIEEMSRAFEARTSGLIIAAVIAAGLTSLALLGNYTYFGTSATMLKNGVDWLAIPLCGVAGGLAGGLFSRIVIVVAQGVPGVAGRAIKRHPVLFAFVCGLAVAVCGLASGDTIYGTGYSQVKHALETGIPLAQSFAPLKLVGHATFEHQRYSRRHLCAVTRGGRGPRRRHRAAFPGRAARSNLAAWHGVVFCRRRAGADNSVRHRHRDDGQPHHGGAADGGVADCLCNLPADLP